MAHHLSPQDVVPPLRGDLEASPPPTGTGAEVITVAPVDSDGAMRMHGFEFSIARMLDGRRTANDVLVNCERLGLPVSLPALEDFLVQLEAHGLLGRSPLVRARPTWHPEIRDLYRDALRAAREGNPHRAREAIERLLTLAPATLEAVRLRTWLDRHPDPAEGGQTFLDTFREVLEGWAADRPASWSTRARDALGRARWQLLAVACAIACVAGSLLVPTPNRVSASASLTPSREERVLAPAAALIDQVLVEVGDRVEPGAALFAYDLDGEQVQTVRAPAAGVVTAIHVRPGQLLEQEQLALRLDELDRLKLIATVTPKHARSAQVGDPITVRIGDQRLRTVIEAVGDTEIAAELPNPGAQLKPGVVQVQLELAPSAIVKR